ncbi:hypothetical protein Dimus_011199 [Dionaea muscipula]
MTSEKMVAETDDDDDHHRHDDTSCKEVLITDDELQQQQQHVEEGGPLLPLPGFRFHPTDEELLSFYLRRKVEKRPISIELIKEMDLYKHDPWDLAKTSCGVGDKEWYFYCKRGRKYKNSVRPNRVTGSGFWKATGIDMPIYSSSSSNYGSTGGGGEGRGGSNHEYCCIGLKKSLVYYQGSGGKGNKTDWMMHELRFPTPDININASAAAQDAEIWTICRIFKRSKKYTPDWRGLVSAAKQGSKDALLTKTASHAESSINGGRECYLNFQKFAPNGKDSKEITTMNHRYLPSDESKGHCVDFDGSQWSIMSRISSPMTTNSSYSSSCSLSQTENIESHDDQLLATYGTSWDDLHAIVEFATRTSFP